MIISFGWTSPALLAGVKTCTRRDWTEHHASWFRAGDLVDAWNTSPRNVRANPHKIATLRLTADVVLSREYPVSDYEAEGLHWLDDLGYKIHGIRAKVLWLAWQQEKPALYVVRFEVVEPGAE